MANIIQIKRRLTGTAGAPTGLKSAELAWNMADNTLYGGKGDDGNGDATQVVALGGIGAFLALSGNQTVDGSKTFTSPIAIAAASANNHAVRKDQLDSAIATVNTALAGKANTSHTHSIANVTGLQAALDGKADTGHGHAIADVTGLQTALDGKADDGHGHAIADITGLQDALDANSTAASDNASAIETLETTVAGKADATHSHTIAQVSGLQTSLNAKAPLASPALTGTPTAPTAPQTTNNTQIATTAFVKTAVDALVAAAPGALDTLNELAAALGDNPNFATDIAAQIGTKLSKASNLSDLTNVAAARGNLGLGSLATQNAGAVNITGGSISNVSIDAVTLDGGSF